MVFWGADPDQGCGLYLHALHFPRYQGVAGRLGAWVPCVIAIRVPRLFCPSLPIDPIQDTIMLCMFILRTCNHFWVTRDDLHASQPDKCMHCISYGVLFSFFPPSIPSEILLRIIYFYLTAKHHWKFARMNGYLLLDQNDPFQSVRCVQYSTALCCLSVCNATIYYAISNGPQNSDHMVFSLNSKDISAYIFLY